MAKITYLFGAGASYGSLPIVEEIPNRLKSLIDKLTLPENQLSDSDVFVSQSALPQFSKNTYQKEMIEDLNWMLTESSAHASIDTFAKKLFLKRESEQLERLKLAMSVFFVFEQSLNETNKRYDAFFASILNNSMMIPEEIKILSWNYDYQFEKAYAEFTDSSDLQTLQSRLRIRSKNWKARSTDFSIFKLNGTTTVFNKTYYNPYSFSTDINSTFNTNLIDEVTRNYAHLKKLKRDHWGILSFAWEYDYSDEEYLKTILPYLNDCEIVVVIGYSFPFFNRTVDRALFVMMPKLRKVYIQDPFATDISERFSAIRPDFDRSKIVPITNLKQFYLPSEL